MKPVYRTFSCLNGNQFGIFFAKSSSGVQRCCRDAWHLKTDGCFLAASNTCQGNGSSKMYIRHMTLIIFPTHP